MTCPEVSAPCAWKTCFAISNPIVLTSDTSVSFKWCYQHLHLGTPMPSRAAPPHQRSDGCIITPIDSRLSTLHALRYFIAAKLTVPRRPLLLKDCDSANGAGCTATDLEGKADEPKPAAADELIEIGKTFHMGDASFGAGQVSLKVRLAFRRGADCFDAEHANAAIRQPMYAFHRQPREVI